jgi:hypothetical protein
MKTLLNVQKPKNIQNALLTKKKLRACLGLYLRNIDFKLKNAFSKLRFGHF